MSQKNPFGGAEFSAAASPSAALPVLTALQFPEIANMQDSQVEASFTVSADSTYGIDQAIIWFDRDLVYGFSEDYQNSRFALMLLNGSGDSWMMAHHR